MEAPNMEQIPVAASPSSPKRRTSPVEEETVVVSAIERAKMQLFTNQY